MGKCSVFEWQLEGDICVQNSSSVLMFLITPSFGALRRLCFVIAAHPEYLPLFWNVPGHSFVWCI